MHMLRWLIVCFCSLILTNCATLSPSKQQITQEEATTIPSSSWEKRAQALSNIQSWDLKAQIAVHQQPKAWSASLQWHQQQQNYHISLFGPLGSHAYEPT